MMTQAMTAVMLAVSSVLTPATKSTLPAVLSGSDGQWWRDPALLVPLAGGIGIAVLAAWFHKRNERRKLAQLSESGRRSTYWQIVDLLDRQLRGLAASHGNGPGRLPLAVLQSQGPPSQGHRKEDHRRARGRPGHRRATTDRPGRPRSRHRPRRASHLAPAILRLSSGIDSGPPWTRFVSATALARRCSLARQATFSADAEHTLARDDR